MKRIYDKESRKALSRFFENCAKAVQDKRIADPGTLGEIAFLLRRFVVWSEGLSGQDEQSSVDWFEHTELYAGFPDELAELLWRKTGVSLVDHTGLNESEPEQTESVEPQKAAEMYDIWLTNGTPKLSSTNITLAAAELAISMLKPNDLQATLPRIVPVGLRDHILKFGLIPERTPEQLGAMAGELLTIAYGETQGDQATSIFDTFNSAMLGGKSYSVEHGRKMTPKEESGVQQAHSKGA